MAEQPQGERFERTTYEFESMPTECTSSRGVDFTESEVLQYFKRTVLSETGEAMALKYSAFYPDGNGGHVLMLGWDHGCLIEFREGHHYLDSIFAHGKNESNTRNTSIYQIERDTPTNLHDRAELHEVPGATGQSPSTWRKVDLSEEDIRISKLITFSLTSCSFACLWPTPDDEDTPAFLAVSHIAFKPPIPVFWIADQRTGGASGGRATVAPRRSESLVSRKVDLNLLASVNSARGELDKYTLDRGNLPLAEKHPLDMRLLLRGPEDKADQVDDMQIEAAPYRTHPYVKLLFSGGDITFSGDLGYNNDPSLIREDETIPSEKPPFHAMGKAFKKYQDLAGPYQKNNITDALAQQILDETSNLLNDEYSFVELHLKSLFAVHALPTTETYATDKFNRLMSRRIAPQPNVKNMVRAAFRLAEAVASQPNDKPQIRETYEQIFAVWNEMQLRCEFPLRVLHEEDVRPTTAPSLRTGAYARAEAPTTPLSEDRKTGIGSSSGKTES